MRTYPLLRQLSRPLVLAVPQQFNDSSLIRRQPSHLLDDLTNESSALAQVALGAGDARFADEGGGFLQETNFTSAADAKGNRRRSKS